MIQLASPLVPVTFTPEIEALIAADAPVAIGVSGGKDSCEVAFRVHEELEARGHKGPRILIHSHLGDIEWEDSLPTCERLAAVLGWELVVVRRNAGGMIERWETRWENNVKRYVELSCVTLILGWSTASMRFCTSELKSQVIASYLVKRFPNSVILSVSGVRASESAQRAKAPVSKVQKRLTSAKHNTWGFDWNAILHASTRDVYASLARRGFELHEAYRIFNTSRVSCSFCILSAEADLHASARCPGNHRPYIRLVTLEVASAFSFQSNRWLGDVAPDLLTPELRDGLAVAKLRAARRERAQAKIPKHLLYDKQGWPRAVPTQGEAELLCEVRREVSETMGVPVLYTEPDTLRARYQELLDEKERREARKRRSGQAAPAPADDSTANYELFAA